MEPVGAHMRKEINRLPEKYPVVYIVEVVWVVQHACLAGCMLL